MSTEKYLVFVIQGYEGVEPETPYRGEKLTDFVELQLIANTYEEALERAQTIMSKSHYRLSNVIEKYADQ